MKRYENDRLRIQKNLKGVRDPEIRRKARALIIVLESDSIRNGCDSVGMTRQTFYEWFNRLKKQDFDIQALAAQSRRPKNSPRKTPEEIEQKIEALHKVYGNSDRLLKFEVQKELNINLSHSTICKILKRRNCVRLYKTPKPNSFKKRYSMPNALDRTQSDTLWTGLTDNHGNRVYMAGIIDDCSRRAFGELYDSVSSDMTTKTARLFFEQVGVPKKSQTDGGTEFTNLYTSLLNPRREKKATLGAFEILLQDYGVEHRITKARTPVSRSC